MNKTIFITKNDLSSEYANNLLNGSFLAHSEETIESLFELLKSLPSPAKEEAFVQFCLIGKDSLIAFN